MARPDGEGPVTLHAPAADAGPAEKKLYNALLVSFGDLGLAQYDWTDGASELGTVAKLLEDQAEELQVAYGSEEGTTGYAASRAYLQLAKVVRKRETEMTNVSGGLYDATIAVVNARDSYRQLSPPLPLDGSELPATATPEERTAASADRQTAINQRNAKAATALTTLDADYQKAAEKMGAPKPDTIPETGGSGPATPVGTGPGSSGALYPGVISTPPPVTELPPTTPTPTPHPPVGPVGPGLVITTPVETGNGELSGSEPTVPTGTLGNHGTGHATGGGMGAASALGAGAISGVGSVMGTRGLSGPRTIGTSSTGQIGKSGTSASRGTLGRTGVAPGQSGQTGTKGGKAGGRGAGRGVVPGSATGQTKGRAGGRGGKGPLASSGTGGRNGKRGEKGEESLEHFEYDDSQSWLDDDATSKPVID